MASSTTSRSVPTHRKRGPKPGQAVRKGRPNTFKKADFARLHSENVALKNQLRTGKRTNAFLETQILHLNETIRKARMEIEQCRILKDFVSQKMREAHAQRLNAATRLLVKGN